MFIQPEAKTKTTTTTTTTTIVTPSGRKRRSVNDTELSSRPPPTLNITRPASPQTMTATPPPKLPEDRTKPSPYTSTDAKPSPQPRPYASPESTGMTYELDAIFNSEPEFSFFMQSFILQRSDVSIFESLPKDNGTNVNELESSFRRIVEENLNVSQHVDVSLFFDKNVNTFFENIKMKYEGKRVIDAVQGIIADSKY